MAVSFCSTPWFHSPGKPGLGIHPVKRHSIFKKEKCKQTLETPKNKIFSVALEASFGAIKAQLLKQARWESTV